MKTVANGPALTYAFSLVLSRQCDGEPSDNGFPKGEETFAGWKWFTWWRLIV
jgi:hypothetical protein